MHLQLINYIIKNDDEESAQFFFLSFFSSNLFYIIFNDTLNATPMDFSVNKVFFSVYSGFKKKCVLNTEWHTQRWASLSETAKRQWLTDGN